MSDWMVYTVVGVVLLGLVGLMGWGMREEEKNHPCPAGMHGVWLKGFGGTMERICTP